MQGLCRAGLYTFAAEITGDTIDLDFFIRLDQHYSFFIADRDTAAAAYTFFWKIQEFLPTVYPLRIVAPKTVQGTTFGKNRGPDTWSIMYGKPSYVEYQPCQAPVYFCHFSAYLPENIKIYQMSP
jgi:hypothetical protein